MIKKPKLDPDTPEFWESLNNGDLVDLPVTVAAQEAGTQGDERDCAIVVTIRRFSSLVYDVQVHDARINVWLKIHDVRWRYRFNPTKESREFAKELYDENTKKKFKDTNVQITFDSRWEIEDKPYKPRPYTPRPRLVHQTLVSELVDGPNEGNKPISTNHSADAEPTVTSPSPAKIMPLRHQPKRSRWDPILTTHRAKKIVG